MESQKPIFHNCYMHLEMEIVGEDPVVGPVFTNPCEVASVFLLFILLPHCLGIISPSSPNSGGVAEDGIPPSLATWSKPAQVPSAVAINGSSLFALALLDENKLSQEFSALG